MSFLFINKPLWLNNLKTTRALSAKISRFVICVETIIYSSKNLDDHTFNFICSKDTDEERVMHSKSDKLEIIMTNDKANEVIKKLCKARFNRCQILLKISMKGSDLIVK